MVFPGGQRAVGGDAVGRAIGEQGVGTGRVVGGDGGALGLAVDLGVFGEQAQAFGGGLGRETTRETTVPSIRVVRVNSDALMMVSSRRPSW